MTTRRNKALRNLIVLAVLIFLLMKMNGLYFSPVQALHASERDLHYGPSEILHQFDLEKSRVFLARYENFISAPVIHRTMGFLWRYGGGTGIENQEERPVFFSYLFLEEHWMVFGIRNDPAVARVEVEVRLEKEGKTSLLSVEEFVEDQFYVIWEVAAGEQYVMDHLLAVRSYDEAGALVDEYVF